MNNNCVWVTTAEMGYGHLRATDPFDGIACQRIILINRDTITPEPERKYWRRILSFYETVSRAKKIPFVGEVLFGMMNYLLKIPPTDASGNFTKPTFQVKMLKLQIKKGLCSGLVKHLEKHHGTLLTSFYAPAIAADMAGINNIYCIICDSDLNRVWVAEHPQSSRIRYFSPCSEATRRLISYGVQQEKIITTGFPLHPELIGTHKLELAEKRFSNRLKKLENYPVFANFNHNENASLNVAFAIGGAGAQVEIAERIFDALFDLISDGLINFTILAGTRKLVKSSIEKNTKMMECGGFRLVWSKDDHSYFRDFNRVIGETDILISKPSEISFYAGLGVPLLIAPPIGAQEEFNRRWLLKLDAGIDLPKISDIKNWFVQNVSNGAFARIATNGFQKIEKAGYYKIVGHLTNKNLLRC